LDEINGCSTGERNVEKKRWIGAKGKQGEEKKKEASNTFILPCNNNYGAHMSKKLQSA
jgi:hypothetical protein